MDEKKIKKEPKKEAYIAKMDANVGVNGSLPRYVFIRNKEIYLTKQEALRFAKYLL